MMSGFAGSWVLAIVSAALLGGVGDANWTMRAFPSADPAVLECRNPLVRTAAAGAVLCCCRTSAGGECCARASSCEYGVPGCACRMEGDGPHRN